jgi:hypothetical protein
MWQVKAKDEVEKMKNMTTLSYSRQWYDVQILIKVKHMQSEPYAMN